MSKIRYILTFFIIIMTCPKEVTKTESSIMTEMKAKAIKIKMKSKPKNALSNTVYNQILNNRPDMKKSTALELSKLITKAAKKHNIPENIFTAILMQESAYKVDAKSVKIKYVLVKGKYKKVVTYMDFGIGQIHHITVRLYKFSIEKLLTNAEYSINAAAIVLSDMKKRFAKREPINWWTRYNCGTKGKNDRFTCQVYKKRVQRYI